MVEPDEEPDVRRKTRLEKKTKMPKAAEGVISPVQSPRWEVRVEEWQRRMREEEVARSEEYYYRRYRRRGRR